MATTYEIVIRGVLSERHAAALDGFEVTARGGDTVLTGKVTDQSHLHGLLERLRRIGADLVRIQAVDDDEEDKS